MVHHCHTEQRGNDIICDQSGTTTVQLWEENIDLLQEGKSCILKGFRVAEYDDVKYLAMCREFSEVLPTQDITDTVEPSPTQTTTDSNFITIDNPKVAAVYKLEMFKMCIRCHSRVEPGVPPLGRCSKTGCAILQDYTLCETSNIAELLMMDGVNKICLYAYGNRIAEIAATQNPSEEQLLTAPPISNITYDKHHSEIIKVERPFMTQS